MNLTVPVVAVREFKLEQGHGSAGFLLLAWPRRSPTVPARPQASG